MYKTIKKADTTKLHPYILSLIRGWYYNTFITVGGVGAGSEVCEGVTGAGGTGGTDVGGLVCAASTVSLLAPDEEATLGSHLWERRLTCTLCIMLG